MLADNLDSLHAFGTNCDTALLELNSVFVHKLLSHFLIIPIFLCLLFSLEDTLAT